MLLRPSQPFESSLDHKCAIQPLTSNHFPLLSRPDSYVMQMNGDDSVAYMFPGKRFRTLQDHFAVNFKTLEQDGLLLHSEGVQGDILTLELRKGRLVLTIGLGRISWNAWGMAGQRL